MDLNTDLTTRTPLMQQAKTNLYRYRYLIGLIVLAAAPFGIGSSTETLLTRIFIFAIFALAFDLIYGYTGVVSFGQALFFGAGAYTAAMLLTYTNVSSIWVLLIAGFLVAGFIGFVVGITSIKASGVYFAIITLAWAQIGFITVSRSTEITGGSNGLSITVPDLTIVPGYLSWSIYESMTLYFLSLFALAAVFIFLKRIVNSQLGAVFLSVRENPERTMYLGYSEKRYRVIAFTIAAAISGVSGVLMSFLVSFVSPELMVFLLSGEVIVWTFLGGRSTLVGPVIGTALILGLEDTVSSIVSWWFIPIGILFIVVVIASPEGVVGLFKQVRTTVQNRGQES